MAEQAPRQAAARWLDAPLLCCGFRPFFLGAALWAVLAMLLWLAMLDGWLPTAAAPLPATLWHAHEMVWGLGLAAVAGFLLTAVPEFTDSAELGREHTAGLLALWLAGRVLWLAAWAGAGTLPWLLLSASVHLALLLWLLALALPRLWRQADRPHLGFAPALLGLLGAEAGFWLAMARGDGDTMPWVNALVGLLMVLIVLAQSRISTRLLHGMLDRFGVHEDDYRAPPPRRGLAIAGIVAVTLAELVGLAPSTLGWLALAASAAVLALMSDWHFGRSLLHRWVWPLYAVYALMAAGYALLGASWLGAPWTSSAGRHLLTVGSMGLAIFAVFGIAGRIHAGRQLDDRPWRVLAALALLLAALVRALASVPASGLPPLAGWWLAGLAWCAAWLLYAVYAWRHLTGPRTDGLSGCAEPADEELPGIAAP